jgi:hypothetical protein
VADFRFASQLCLFVFPEGKIPNLQVTELSSYQLETLYGAWTTMFDDSHMGACRWYLRHHQPHLHCNNGSRGFGIITAQGAPASLTPPPPQQRLEGLRHHRLASAATMARGAPSSLTSARGLVRHHRRHLRYNNGSRVSGITNPAFATTMAQGAPTSSTPSLPQ